MKTIPKLLILAGMVIGFQNVYAQTKEDTAWFVNKVTEKANAKKTLSAWDVLGNLYQISLENLTADDKSVKLKSTIFGIHKIFNPNIVNAKDYARFGWQRHLEPYINYAYKNKFDPSNLSVGVTWSFVNDNDITEAKELNKLNPEIMSKVAAIDAKLDPWLQELTLKAQSNDPNVRKILVDGLNSLYATLSKYVRTGDTTILTRELKDELKRLDVTQDIVKLQLDIDTLARRISNRWNVTFNPQVTYAFNRSAVQGASFMFNGIKGFGKAKKATQLVLKSGFVIGEDTVITAINTQRKQFTNSVGLNQILLTKSIKGDDGVATNVPAAELAVNFGYNYLTKGYTATEERGQKTLNAKLGFLIGKESWLVVPFTYNFATKVTYASLSIKVNLGEPPFKSKK